MAVVGGDCAQRADGAEAAGAAGGVIDGAAEAVAASDLLHAWAAGASCAQAGAAIDGDGGAAGGVAGVDAAAAAAGLNPARNSLSTELQTPFRPYQVEGASSRRQISARANEAADPGGRHATLPEMSPHFRRGSSSGEPRRRDEFAIDGLGGLGREGIENRGN